MNPPWTRGCVALGLIALAACSRDQPSAPQPHSITGHLRLTGFLVDAHGELAGTRVLGDPDGVPVELFHGDELVARTTTVDGVYRFDGLAPGGYVARTRVIGDVADETNPMTIATTDVEAFDTLRLASRGDLYPYPNPFTPMDTMLVHFTVPDTEWIDVRVLDVEGNTVRKLLELRVIPERHTVKWGGRDQMNRPVTGSLFWLTFVSGDDVRAHVLFRQEASASRSAPDP